MKFFLATVALVSAALSASSFADVLNRIPGPDDQGGMEMPMVFVSGNTVSVMFMPPVQSPLLASLEHWAPGDTFEPSAAWYGLLDPTGGEGALFNNQYGFMLMSDGPATGSLAIRLTEASSPLLQGWDYSQSGNLFAEVFSDGEGQVLWNGGMWHNYFTLPANAAPGTYTATFEIFVANATFAGTGFVDYSEAARTAARDMAYNNVFLTYEWTVVPEPSTFFLAALGLGAWGLRRRTRQN